MMKITRGLRPIESLMVEMGCTGAITGMRTEQKRYKVCYIFIASLTLKLLFMRSHNVEKLTIF